MRQNAIEALAAVGRDMGASLARSRAGCSLIPDSRIFLIWESPGTVQRKCKVCLSLRRPDA